jgi:hypothetical protein
MSLYAMQQLKMLHARNHQLHYLKLFLLVVLLMVEVGVHWFL